jgi:cytochrome bd-type quinol oxidase subunit 2
MVNNKSNKVSAFLSILCWFTIVLQFILIIINRQASIFETIIRFFTFFTILTNILVAIVFTASWLQPKNSFQFFNKANTQVAIAVYIFVVGFVYNTILRFIWQPKGWDKVADELLHLVIPIVYILFWYFKFSKKEINYKSIFGWLLFPTLYIVVVMIRGYFSGYYPYPFLHVGNLGVDKVLYNAILMTLFFVVVSFVFYQINNHKFSKMK